MLSEWPHFNSAALGGLSLSAGLTSQSLQASGDLGTERPGSECHRLSSLWRALGQMQGAQWSGGVKLLLPCPPSLPGVGAGAQPELTTFLRSPGRVTSSRCRTQQAGAPTWSGEGQGGRRPGQALAHLPPPRATQGPCLREKENILLFFSSFFPLLPLVS